MPPSATKPSETLRCEASGCCCCLCSQQQKCLGFLHREWPNLHPDPQSAGTQPSPSQPSVTSLLQHEDRHRATAEQRSQGHLLTLLWQTPKSKVQLLELHRAKPRGRSARAELLRSSISYLCEAALLAVQRIRAQALVVVCCFTWFLGSQVFYCVWIVCRGKSSPVSGRGCAVEHLCVLWHQQPLWLRAVLYRPHTWIGRDPWVTHKYGAPK